MLHLLYGALLILALFTGVGVIAWMKNGGSVKLTKRVWVVCTLLILVGIGWWWRPWSRGTEIVTEARAQTTVTAPTVRLAGRPDNWVEIETVNFFHDRNNISDPDESWKMVQVGEAESGFRQFEADGITPLHRRKTNGEIDLDYVGVYQINTRLHAKEIAETGFDPNTLEGNLKFALYLYKKKEDFGPWVTKNKALEIVKNAEWEEIEIPAGNSLEKKYPKDKSRCGFKQLTPIYFHGDGTKPVLLEVGAEVHVSTSTFYFKALDDAPGRVKFRCM